MRRFPGFMTTLVTSFALFACSSIAYQNLSCGAPPQIDVGHSGPNPIEIHIPDYPTGLGDGFVRVAYEIDRQGRATNPIIIQTEPYETAPGVTFEIVYSMRFDQTSQKAESVISFKRGWMATCSKRV